jgi:hypothetical protein
VDLRIHSREGESFTTVRSGNVVRQLVVNSFGNPQSNKVFSTPQDLFGRKGNPLRLSDLEKVQKG